MQQERFRKGDIGGGLHAWLQLGFGVAAACAQGSFRFDETHPPTPPQNGVMLPPPSGRYRQAF